MSPDERAFALIERGRELGPQSSATEVERWVRDMAEVSRSPLGLEARSAIEDATRAAKRWLEHIRGT